MYIVQGCCRTQVVSLCAVGTASLHESISFVDSARLVNW